MVQEAETSKKSKKNTLLLLSLAHSSNDICWMMIPLLLPLIKEQLHLTYTQSGLLLACLSLTYSVFSIVAGHLGDVYKAERILSFGFLFTVAAFPFLFLAHSYFQILVVLAVIAVGISVFHPVGTALISRGWGKGIYFGLFETAAAVGILIMTLLFPPLVASLGWRLTFLILALPSLPIGFVFLLSRWDIEYVGSAGDPQNGSVGTKSLILFYLARGAQMLGGIAVFSFMPLFAVDVGGLSSEKAAFFLLFIFIGAAPGMLICGILSDYYSPLKIIFTLGLIVIPTIFILTLSLPLTVTFIFLGILGFCSIGAWAPQGAWLAWVTSQRTRGKVFGGMMGLLGLVRTTSPLLFGFLADKWGLLVAFRWAIFPMVIGVLCLGEIVRRTKQVR